MAERSYNIEIAEADVPSVPLMHLVQKKLSHLKTRLESVKSREVVAPFGPEGIAKKLLAQPRVC